jgi:hypothetical protein
MNEEDKLISNEYVINSTESVIFGLQRVLSSEMWVSSKKMC